MHIDVSNLSGPFDLLVTGQSGSGPVAVSVGHLTVLLELDLDALPSTSIDLLGDFSANQVTAGFGSLHRISRHPAVHERRDVCRGVIRPNGTPGFRIEGNADPVRPTTVGQRGPSRQPAGETDAINLAVDLVRKNGRILFFGYPRGQYLKFNFEQFFHKCADATTIVRAFEEPNLTSTRQALAAIAAGEIDVSPLITHHFPFERVIEAYELHRTRGDGAVKIVIDMP